jgi:hypothetical protein
MAGQLYNPQQLPNPATLETGLWHGIIDGQGELNWEHFWRTGDTAIVRDGVYLRHGAVGSFKGVTIPDFVTNDPDVRPGDWWVMSQGGAVFGVPVNAGQMVAINLDGDPEIIELTLEVDIVAAAIIPPGTVPPEGNVVAKAAGQMYTQLAADRSHIVRVWTYDGEPNTSVGWL